MRSSARPTRRRRSRRGAHRTGHLWQIDRERLVDPRRATRGRTTCRAHRRGAKGLRDPSFQEVLVMTTKKTAANQQDAEKVPQLVRLRDTDQTVSSSDEDIRGRMAKDKDGHDLGTIEGLLVDEAEQKVRFMEVGSGGFLGLGESKSLIPVEAITRMTPDAVYIGHTLSLIHISE